MQPASRLTEATARARACYLARLVGDDRTPWWTAVVVTASSARQTECFEEPIRFRRRLAISSGRDVSGRQGRVFRAGVPTRLCVELLGLSESRREEFFQRFLLYDTGLRRIAKNLLGQVVGRYLARETAGVEMLHSIKTLALEMGCAMREGDWERSKQLLGRH